MQQAFLAVFIGVVIIISGCTGIGTIEVEIKEKCSNIILGSSYVDRNADDFIVPACIRECSTNGKEYADSWKCSKDDTIICSCR